MSRSHAAWGELIPDDQWRVYRNVIHGLRRRGIPFALGGAFALAAYTARWRNTKDLDLYILPQDREAVIDVITGAGLTDLYERLPYERHWIYRASRDDIIVDAIWGMANHKADVDPAWLTRGPTIALRGEPLRVLPAEELVWDKMYIVQRERCDWPDVLNLIDATCDGLDWEHLLHRTGPDTPLLAGVLTVFRWLCPGKALTLPAWIWPRLQMPPPENHQQPDVDCEAVRLLDTRPWFHAAANREGCAGC